jgi:hypothetical protein
MGPRKVKSENLAALSHILRIASQLLATKDALRGLYPYAVLG